jgi:multidrug efflux pump subunit AcrA (membrane-fusion protein)
VLNSIGAGILPNAATTLELFVFQAPSGPAAATYTRRDVISDGFTITPTGGNEEGQGIPAWSLVLTYAKIWRTQSSGEVAGAVSDARKAYLELAERQVTAQDATVKIAHPLASEITIATLLTQAVDALVEVARRIGLYKVRRDRLTFPVAFDRAIEIGQIAEVKMRRFGYDGGKLFIVTGRRDDFRKRVATLELWG